MEVEPKSRFEKYYMTPESIKRLKDLEGDIEFLESELQRAEYVGLDVTEIRKRVTEMKDTRVKLIETYAPPK